MHGSLLESSPNRPGTSTVNYQDHQDWAVPRGDLHAYTHAYDICTTMCTIQYSAVIRGRGGEEEGGVPGK